MRERTIGMKHLLSGVAVAAALVIAAPVWAQNPSGGNAVGTPGPNPGGPGLTPYSGGAPASAANSAMPPAHRHARAMHHFHHYMAHKAALSGDTTAQLNREELGRIQSGNLGNPPAPPQGSMAPPEGSMEPNSSGRPPGPKASSGSYIPPNQP
jgi:hypothetical protein